MQGSTVRIARVVAVAIKDRSADDINLPVFGRPQAREPLEDLPNPSVKLAELGSHIRHDEGVVDRHARLGHIAARRQVPLVEDALIVVGRGRCGGSRKPYVGTEAI